MLRLRFGGLEGQGWRNARDYWNSLRVFLDGFFFRNYEGIERINVLEGG